MLDTIKRYFLVGDPAWAVRRRGTIVLTAFACAVIWYATQHVADASKATTIVGHMVWLISIIWPAYVGAATAETVMRRGPQAPAGPGAGAE